MRGWRQLNAATRLPNLKGAPLMKSTRRMFVPFFVGVVVIQGFHVIEHIVQLIQVYVFDMADDDAFGLLGLIFHPNGKHVYVINDSHV